MELIKDISKIDKQKQKCKMFYLLHIDENIISNCMIADKMIPMFFIDDTVPKMQLLS